MGQPDESNDYRRQPTAKLPVAVTAAVECYESVSKQMIASQREISSVDATFEQHWKAQWHQSSQVIAEAMKRTRRVKLLGELGWTMPMEMSWPEFQDLATQDNLTVERVNEWFVNYYNANNASEFKRLAHVLLLSRQLAFWKVLIEQCLRAFERGDFALCVPSLLLILEGSIAKPWRVTFENPKSRRVFFERKISASALKPIREYKWRSVAAFADNVFRARPSDEDLHRHLILHGKSDPAKWDRAYCLRLFQAISTVASLAEEIPAVPVEGDRQHS